jgi:hypothetical protein
MNDPAVDRMVEQLRADRPDMFLSGKPLIDRAHELLCTALGAGVMQANDAAGLEEIARDCVRVQRALTAEVANATARPVPQPKRPQAQRPAGLQPEEEFEVPDLPEGWEG